MMQKEVAQRICGKPKTKDYNALSVFIQYYSNAKIAINVPASSFYPAPDVESSVVLIERKEIVNKAVDEIAFNSFVKDIFLQRRKTLMNNISKTNYSKEKVSKILEEKGFFILPSELFCNIKKGADKGHKRYQIIKDNYSKPILTTSIATIGRIKRTVIKVYVAVAFVSPAPRSPPAIINCELWKG